MNPFLTRLGILPELQTWLTPFYHIDETGNLCFSYGDDMEIFGMAYHRVPPGTGCWQACTGNQGLVRLVVIGSSAMEIIAWLNCHFSTVKLDYLLLIASGNSISLSRRIKNKCILVLGNDLLGRICDLKAASVLAGQPAEIALETNTVLVNFRNQRFHIPAETFSLYTFERLSGYRFNVKTSKPRRHSSWLNQLLND